MAWTWDSPLIDYLAQTVEEAALDDADLQFVGVRRSSLPPQLRSLRFHVPVVHPRNVAPDISWSPSENEFHPHRRILHTMSRLQHIRATTSSNRVLVAPAHLRGLSESRIRRPTPMPEASEMRNCRSAPPIELSVIILTHDRKDSVRGSYYSS